MSAPGYTEIAQAVSAVSTNTQVTATLNDLLSVSVSQCQDTTSSEIDSTLEISQIPMKEEENRPEKESVTMEKCVDKALNNVEVASKSATSYQKAVQTKQNRRKRRKRVSKVKKQSPKSSVRNITSLLRPRHKTDARLQVTFSEKSSAISLDKTKYAKQFQKRLTKSPDKNVNEKTLEIQRIKQASSVVISEYQDHLEKALKEVVDLKIQEVKKKHLMSRPSSNQRWAEGHVRQIQERLKKSMNEAVEMEIQKIESDSRIKPNTTESSPPLKATTSCIAAKHTRKSKTPQSTNVSRRSRVSNMKPVKQLSQTGHSASTLGTTHPYSECNLRRNDELNESMNDEVDVKFWKYERPDLVMGSRGIMPQVQRSYRPSTATSHEPESDFEFETKHIDDRNTLMTPIKTRRFIGYDPDGSVNFLKLRHMQEVIMPEDRSAYTKLVEKKLKESLEEEVELKVQEIERNLRTNPTSVTGDIPPGKRGSVFRPTQPASMGQRLYFGPSQQAPEEPESFFEPLHPTSEEQITFYHPGRSESRSTPFDPDVSRSRPTPHYFNGCDDMAQSFIDSQQQGEFSRSRQASEEFKRDQECSMHGYVFGDRPEDSMGFTFPIRTHQRNSSSNSSGSSTTCNRWNQKHHSRGLFEFKTHFNDSLTASLQDEIEFQVNQAERNSLGNYGKKSTIQSRERQVSFSSQPLSTGLSSYTENVKSQDNVTQDAHDKTLPKKNPTATTQKKRNASKSNAKDTAKKIQQGRKSTVTRRDTLRKADSKQKHALNLRRKQYEQRREEMKQKGTKQDGKKSRRNPKGILIANPRQFTGPTKTYYQRSKTEKAKRTSGKNTPTGLRQTLARGAKKVSHINNGVQQKVQTR